MPLKNLLGLQSNPASSSPFSPSATQKSQLKETEASVPSEQAQESLLTRSSVPSLDFSPPDPTEQRTGASSRDNMSSPDRQRRTMARAALGSFTLGIGIQMVYIGRECEPEELRGKKMMPQNSFHNLDRAPVLHMIRTCASDSNARQVDV
ncbi:hypothetical protein EV361DRAFT_920563 [Lentinula raphanica]|nr:hypothetical protein EV361DRAFT_920563 [Lentinula raphanica]